MSFWAGKSVVVTGGSGSLGQAIVPLLVEAGVRRLVVFSRGEHRQHDMQARWPEYPNGPMRYLVGDVRSRDRLHRALHGVDVVIHAAALKHVPVCQRDPWEAIDTNIGGTRNVIEAAIDEGVARVVVVSSDKSCAAATLYGATKYVAEAMAVAANGYAGAGPTRIAAVRYGNVIGSAGSVLHVWRRQLAAKQPIEVTDIDSTRFWITLPDAARFVLGCTEIMAGREVFIPRLCASRVADLADAVAPGADHRTVGLRAGEKRHEVLIGPDEVDRAWSFVAPTVPVEDGHLRGYMLWPTVDMPGPLFYVVERIPPGFVYSSDTAPRLQVTTLQRIVREA